MSKSFVCFGELLIRLSVTGGHVLEALAPLQPVVGGAEANVAVGLARLGHDTRMVSRVPDNGLGTAAINELRRWGVGTHDITRGPQRMGLYFLTPGAIHRPSDIVYDRAGSAFAVADFSQLDWPALLQGANWLHVSGVTAALGENCVTAALNAMQQARALGVKVSFDCNYRPKLWADWGGDAPAYIMQLMAQADLIFGGYRDIELVSGLRFADERAAADHAFASFPHLERLVCTRREQINVDHNRLTGLMYLRDRSLETDTYSIERIVDRIGGGDAFAAGVMHGLLTGATDEKALDYGIACACLKHAQPGDASLATPADLDAFLSDDGFDVKR
ncbi:sugar kinase [Asticcacaulis sp. 201]|uniref:sugar kinase n=1 Tax=Asticcacaulis sp. 201 TaxID=3028787 RepID=UPI002916332B|nr:sugar kinase [Asticcacaulis sp. 201]MDV6331710.1 sugar kinase [Asticcacaulis sp. 201]